MKYALIVKHYGLSEWQCEAVFKYYVDAETLAEHIHNHEKVHTAVIKLATGKVIIEFET